MVYDINEVVTLHEILSLKTFTSEQLRNMTIALISSYLSHSTYDAFSMQKLRKPTNLIKRTVLGKPEVSLKKCVAVCASEG
jgi:hypothetical protein